ncbi:SAM-dependent methyltransferase [Sphingomonas sp. ac-8]|uniref:SAM-dependent methyltransferase n=1 Tax=Sphingomonas sp. ac-8 TaxID=3242977 RepID=UPI003A7FFDBF
MQAFHAKRLSRPAGAPAPGSRTARSDPRWPQLAATLAALRLRGRFAVRIVDADCGCGTLLIETVRHARALGFTAIEGRGIDGAPALIGRARAAAGRLRDPAIGLVFECADAVRALTEEAVQPADIVLWHATDGERAAAVLRASADVVIGEAAANLAGRRAA